MLSTEFNSMHVLWGHPCVASRATPASILQRGVYETRHL